MTKFILVGGYPYKANDGGKAMCTEAISGFSEPINVLICLFARPSERWDELFKENKLFFDKNLPNTELDFALADENNLINQIEKTDLLYFSGGDTTELTNGLKKSPEWFKKLDGRNVMGSSAGTDILSTYNYDLELSKCSNGFGLVPVKTIVHYKAKEYTPPIGWKAAYKNLKDYKEDLPILALREGNYKAIEI